MKTRRDFLKCSAALGAALTSASTAIATKKHGVLTVEGHRAHKHLTGDTLHVFIDGVDVTRNCYEADDVGGYVKVFCRDREHHKQLDAKGALHIDDGGAACQMIVRGTVVIAPGVDI